MGGPCLCGGEDCPRCFPDRAPDRCSRHRDVHLDEEGECSACQDEFLDSFYGG